MRRVSFSVALAVALLACSSAARASSFTISGYLDDAANVALVASDGYGDLQGPRFGSAEEIARNVAIYQLTVTTGGAFQFTSSGWAAGGAEPYFTIFAGSGGSSTFLASNYFDPSIDFSFTQNLAAGTYMLALGVWANESFAENNPDADPSLGDGFTALGDPGRLGTAYYEVSISSDDGESDEPVPGGGKVPVPEPSTLALMVCGVAGLLRARQRPR